MGQMSLKSMDDVREKFIVVDFRNTLWKSWKVAPKDGDMVRESDGYLTGHIFRFFRTLAKWKGVFGGNLVFCYEGGEKFRYTLFPDYKGTRNRDLEFDPVPDAKRMISHMKCLELKPRDAEADDAIAAFVTRKSKASHLILSSDKDLWQLRSPTVQIMSFQDILNEPVIEKSCLKHFGTKYPKDITMAKALYGDTSDNLPRVPRLLKKHVAPLLEKAGTPDEFFALLDELPVKTAKKIREHEEQIRKVYRAVQLRADTPMKKRVRNGDPEGLEAFLREFECYSLLSKVKFMAS